MLTAIGIMIGCYIITRMTSLLSRQDQRAESALVKVFAVVTIIVTLIITADSAVRGMSPSVPIHR
jgi:hypothetical protein